MTKAFRELCSELWAITPDWLQILAALAQRDRSHPMVLGAYKAGEDDMRQPTPEERFRGLQYIGAVTRALPGQGSGRAVVADRVAILPVLGPIFPRANMMTQSSGATSLAQAHQDLAAAWADDSVDSILHVIDSPGGAVSGTSAFADAIYAGRGRKPMAAYVTGTGASAAYWIASASERITMNKTALVGSIGVVAGMSKQVQADKNGDMHIEVVSSNAPNKRVDVTTDEGYAEIRRNLDAIENHFIADVARGRGVKKEQVIADFGQGGCFVGTEAVSAGMVDAVEGFDAAFLRMARIGKASRARQAAGG